MTEKVMKPINIPDKMEEIEEELELIEALIDRGEWIEMGDHLQTSDIPEYLELCLNALRAIDSVKRTIAPTDHAKPENEKQEWYHIGLAQMRDNVRDSIGVFAL